MENTALILIVITNVVLVLILGALSFLIFKLVKNSGTSNKSTPESTSPSVEDKYHPAILERMKELKKVQPKRMDMFCPNHPDEPGEASCAVCDKLYCTTCIRPYKSLHFCREHLNLIMHHEWDEVVTIKTSTANPEEGVKLYDVKKKLFEDMNLPTYVETHYKINVDHDYIETYLVLFSVKENVATVKEQLSEIFSI